MKNNEHNSLAEQTRQAAQETAEMVQRHPAPMMLPEHLAAAQLRMPALRWKPRRSTRAPAPPAWEPWRR